MSRFKRGLSARLVASLNEAYAAGGWWRALADDPQLIVALRDDYLNVYWKGNSLLRLFLRDGHLVGEVHYKYLLRPAIGRNPYLRFDGERFGAIDPADLFLKDLSNVASLKRSADVHAGDEKTGVHRIVTSNPNIVDVEVAFGEEDERSEALVARRIDFAALRLEHDGPTLTFYEAKTFASPDLRADGDRLPRILDQLKAYETFLRERGSDVLAAYRTVCGNLLDLAGVRERFASMHGLLEAIARGERAMRIDPEVRLVVFGYDRDQADGARWAPHREKLETHLRRLPPQTGSRLLMKGDPEGFTRGISSPAG